MDPDPGKEIEVDPDPDPQQGLKWIRIRPNAEDPGGSGSGSETLVFLVCVVVAFLKPLSPLCLGGEGGTQKGGVSANSYLSIFSDNLPVQSFFPTFTLQSNPYLLTDNKSMSVCLGKHLLTLQEAGTAASIRADITKVRSLTSLREREVSGTSTSNQTTYDIGRVGLIQLHKEPPRRNH